MSSVHFEEGGWLEYLDWQTEDRKTLRKINELIREIQRTPFSGRGKPEALRGNLSGYWSRRIDKVNRLVYYMKDGAVYVVSCRGHYDD